MKNTVAIILARGGSKGIPKKNIIDFCGKPLLAWSIIQAINVKEISKVWVSSDNDEFLKIARKYGAGTIKRPKHIATSTSSPVLGWLHAIQHIEKIGKNVDGVVALQPTSPVRESLDISKGIKKFYRSKYDSIFSASEIGDFFIWQKINGRYKSVNYNYHHRPRRQEFPKQYVENGSFYIFKPQIIKKIKNQLGGKIGITTMEFWKIFEIDSVEDKIFCELIMKNYLLQRSKV